MLDVDAEHVLPRREFVELEPSVRVGSPAPTATTVFGTVRELSRDEVNVCARDGPAFGVEEAARDAPVSPRQEVRARAAAFGHFDLVPVAAGETQVARKFRTHLIAPRRQPRDLVEAVGVGSGLEPPPLHVLCKHSDAA